LWYRGKRVLAPVVGRMPFIGVLRASGGEGDVSEGGKNERGAGT
jgi:hypothetical protein